MATPIGRTLAVPLMNGLDCEFGHPCDSVKSFVLHMYGNIYCCFGFYFSQFLILSLEGCKIFFLYPDGDESWDSSSKA